MKRYTYILVEKFQKIDTAVTISITVHRTQCSHEVYVIIKELIDEAYEFICINMINNLVTEFETQMESIKQNKYIFVQILLIIQGPGFPLKKKIDLARSLI